VTSRWGGTVRKRLETLSPAETHVASGPPGGGWETFAHRGGVIFGRSAIRAHPTASVANRFCVSFVKCGIFASYGQRYGNTGHPTNVANQICQPSYWWARYKSSRIIWRWFAGGSYFSIGRPYHCRLGRRMRASERFANRMCLQLCLNGGQTPKPGRSQSNTRCVDDRAGVSRCEIRRHVVASGPRFRSRRRRRSFPGPVGGGGETRFLLVDIRRHARFWVGPPHG